MTKLASIRQRLNNPNLCRIEWLQRDSFLTALKSFKLTNAHALSVSCGDGIWDYLALFNRTGIAMVTATDIVPCPVKTEDIALLQTIGTWSFHQVQPDHSLPFHDDSFDVVWHQDVIEHTGRPFLFLKEQYRVLRAGGAIIVGTPNLLRPANMIKACLGKLQFPIKIGEKEEIGDYIHIQEFHEQQIQLMMQEIGFYEIRIRHLFFGLPTFNLCLQDYPTGNVGRTFTHFLFCTARK